MTVDSGLGAEQRVADGAGMAVAVLVGGAAVGVGVGLDVGVGVAACGIGEAAGLRWRNVDFVTATVTITHAWARTAQGWWFAEPKTAHGRRALPLPALAVAALHRQRTAVRELRLAAGTRWVEHDLVFPSRHGTPLRHQHVMTAFHKVLDEAGLARRRPHDLRHTYATRLFAMDVHPRVVQELLGHSRIDITIDIYTGSMPETLRAAAVRMDEVFSAAEDAG
ncbi:MAG: site-specific integrase [Actinobacteria bacterium]|nr:site-specific integrase [Actinomycetota bacterium]